MADTQNVVRVGRPAAGRRRRLGLAASAAVLAAGVSATGGSEAEAHPLNAISGAPCGSAVEPVYQTSPRYFINPMPHPWETAAINAGHNNFDALTDFNDSTGQTAAQSEVVWNEDPSVNVDVIAAAPWTVNANCEIVANAARINFEHFANTAPFTIDHKTCATVHEVGHVAGLSHSNQGTHPPGFTAHAAADSMMLGQRHRARCETGNVVNPLNFDIIDIDWKY